MQPRSVTSCYHHPWSRASRRIGDGISVRLSRTSHLVQVVPAVFYSVNLPSSAIATIWQGVPMARRSQSPPASGGDEKLSVLEIELTKATESFRRAKLAAREAKAQAKIAKKEMKRVRRAWVAAVAEQDKAAATALREKEQAAAASSKARAKTRTTGPNGKRRVAGSPEIVRKPRRTKKQPALVAATATGDSPASVPPSATAEGETGLNEAQ